MATPQVAGAVALILEAAPSLTPEEVKAILLGSARDDGKEPGWDKYHGSGVLNVYLAVGIAFGFLDPDTMKLDETGHPIIEKEARPPVTASPTPTPRVIVNQAPKVDFAWGPSVVVVTEPVVFTDRSRDPEGSTLVAWNWDFGDGATEKGERVAHKYERPGTYTVRLTVTDLQGTAGSAQKELEVIDPDGKAKDAPAMPVVVVLFVLLAAAAFLRRR